MEKNEYDKFIKDQLEEMKKHKWIESEKVGYDLGQDAIMDWVEKYAAAFRFEWHEKNPGQKH